MSNIPLQPSTQTSVTYFLTTSIQVVALCVKDAVQDSIFNAFDNKLWKDLLKRDTKIFARWFSPACFCSLVLGKCYKSVLILFPTTNSHTLTNTQKHTQKHTHRHIHTHTSSSKSWLTLHYFSFLLSCFCFVQLTFTLINLVKCLVLGEQILWRSGCLSLCNTNLSNLHMNL